jgi:hypothetical protein
MTDARHERLLDRILTSRQFSHAESLKRVLRYICEQSGEEAKGTVREYDIAVHALGRPAGFDPKSDPIVRVSVAGIRDRLRSYFETEGSHEPVRIEIPLTELRAVYAGRPAGETNVTDELSGAMKFWRPYLTPGASNVLVYAEVLFFRDPAFTYVRNIFVNDVATGPEDLRARLPQVDFSGFTPSYHFAPAGEMHCVLFLTRQFQEMRALLEVRTARHIAWNELRARNLIFIGSARTNSFVQSLQGEQPFVLTADSIVNRFPKAGEPHEYASRRYMEGDLHRVTEYALVTRQGGLSPNTCTTIISGNHGRSHEGAGFYLSRADALERMMQSMGIAEGEPLPPRFQVLLRVEMIDFNEDVVSVDYLTHRVF